MTGCQVDSSDLTTAYQHIPVLLAEVTQQLNPSRCSVVVDCTFGYGGHASALLSHIAPRATFIGIDRDEGAHITQHTAPPHVARLGQQETLAQLAQSREIEFILVRDNFANLDRILRDIGVGYVDAFLFDIGVSSPQIDDPARGFSYHQDGPLDMRMDRSLKRTAADLANEEDEAELTRILRTYGEERWASRIAHFIVARRKAAPIETTGQLVDLVREAIPAAARREGGHPAKRTFQALRIALNGELDALERGLESAIRWLRPEGRVAVLTFHSLEDRLVKRMFRDHALRCSCPPDMPICQCGCTPALEIITRKAIVPSAAEIEANPRARSTKLRVAQKLEYAPLRNPVADADR